ncbi:MAG: hypothetical protein ACI3Y5_04750 [Prevotella sp.]
MDSLYTAAEIFMIALSLAVIFRIFYSLVREVYSIVRHLMAGEKRQINAVSISLHILTALIAVWWSTKIYYHIYRLLP